MSFTIDDYLKGTKKQEVPAEPERETKMGFSDHPYPKCWTGCECC